MITVQEFLNYKQKMEKLINKKVFCGRMLFQALIDDDFCGEIMPFVDFFNNYNFNHEEVNNNLIKLHNKTEYYFLKAKSAKRDKLKYYLKSLAYFYFLESIDEHSSFSEKLLEAIKTRYGNDYLMIIAQIDKEYLSADMKKYVNSPISTKQHDCPLLLTYRVLKYWQDFQHSYFNGEFGEETNNFQAKYCNNPNISPYDIDLLTLRKYLFKKIRKNKILDLDTVSLLCGLYIKKYIVQLVGGKMYGLGILNLYGLPVPYTVVIPTKTKIYEKDICFLKNECEKFSVRSSADIEDGENNSFAGMFDSYLNVPFENIQDAINKVKGSVNNKRLQSYIIKVGAKEPKMAVIIQKFIEPKLSGVWIGNSMNGGVLEWVQGNGEKLVSGNITPTSEIWENKETKSSKIKLVNNNSIGKILIKYQERLGVIADFEWMILEDQLIMLQFRPVTKKIIGSKLLKDNKNVFLGTPASPGSVTGLVYLVNNYNENIQENKILLAHSTDPNWIPHLLKSKAVITATGGYLCHAAIVCRELGIPCITGIGNESFNELINNIDKELTVDGLCGTISIG